MPVLHAGNCAGNHAGRNKQTELSPPYCTLTRRAALDKGSGKGQENVHCPGGRGNMRLRSESRTTRPPHSRDSKGTVTSGPWGERLQCASLAGTLWGSEDLSQGQNCKYWSHVLFLKAPSDGSVESKEATALAPGRDDQGFDWNRIVERRSSGQAGRAEAELMRQDDLGPREVGLSHIHNWAGHDSAREWEQRRKRRIL